MADRDEFERKGDERGLLPPTDAIDSVAKASNSDALPEVESPSISPAVSEAVAAEDSKIEPKPEPEVDTARRAAMRALVPVRHAVENETPFEPLTVEQARPHFKLKPRQWRMVRLAAAVAVGAGFGAIAGSYLTGHFGAAPNVDVAAQDEKNAMRQSMARMAKELTTLKAGLDASARQAEGRTATLEKRISDKINERVNERFNREASSEMTGSIPAAPAAAPTVATAEVPMPRPAPRLAMAQTEPARASVVHDWSIRGAHNGFVYVQGRDGDIYQVVPGAPLPGLGPVESIRRFEGRWVVTTPKGIIVSMQDRRSFE